MCRSFVLTLTKTSYSLNPTLQAKKNEKEKQRRAEIDAEAKSAPNPRDTENKELDLKLKPLKMKVRDVRAPFHCIWHFIHICVHIHISHNCNHVSQSLLHNCNRSSPMVIVCFVPLQTNSPFGVVATLTNFFRPK